MRSYDEYIQDSESPVTLISTTYFNQILFGWYRFQVVVLCLQVRMKDSIMSLLQTVRLIHSVSQFYNTSERTSSLMVKV